MLFLITIYLLNVLTAADLYSLLYSNSRAIICGENVNSSILIKFEVEYKRKDTFAVMIFNTYLHRNLLLQPFEFAY